MYSHAVIHERVPFVYFPPRWAVAMAKRTPGLTGMLLRFFPELEHDLDMAGVEFNKHEFLTLSMMNSFMWFFFSSGLLFVLINVVGTRTYQESIYFSLGLGVFVFSMMFFVTIRYPKIKGGKKAEQVERNLVFALKDLLLQISAGLSLYDAFVCVSNSDFGEVSAEFEIAAKQIQSGKPMDEALESMALRTNSEYLKRSVWQIVNVMRSGSNFKTALRGVIDDLLEDHREKIRAYAQELNMWSLMFMMFAVAIPTIGSTVMLIMTSFSGASITRSSFIVFGVLCLVIQYAIIGLIKSRRPQINF